MTEQYIAYYSIKNDPRATWTATASSYKDFERQLRAHLGRKALPPGSKINTVEYDKKVKARIHDERR